MLRTLQGRVIRASTSPVDIAEMNKANEPVVGVPDENCRNPSREAKHQRDLLNGYFSHIGALAGQEERI